MRQNRVLIVRLVLLGLFLAFVAGFVVDQYSPVRSFVRFLCISCLGLSD